MPVRALWCFGVTNLYSFLSVAYVCIILKSMYFGAAACVYRGNGHVAILRSFHAKGVESLMHSSWPTYYLDKVTIILSPCLTATFNDFVGRRMWLTPMSLNWSIHASFRDSIYETEIHGHWFVGWRSGWKSTSINQRQGNKLRNSNNAIFRINYWDSVSITTRCRWCIFGGVDCCWSSTGNFYILQLWNIAR